MPVERSERARAVLRTLLAQYLKTNSTHPIGKDSDVRQVFLMDDGTAIVDTTPAFADSHPSGVLAEELTVASVVLTLNANDSKITRVKILVNGQERETLAGHADLKRFYEAAQHGSGRKGHAVRFGIGNARHESVVDKASFHRKRYQAPIGVTGHRSDQRPLI